MNSAASSPGTFPAMGIELFLRSDPGLLRQYAVRRPTATGWFCVGSIILGAGFYGAAIGSWRDGWQALYTGIKLPLVLLFTTLGNGLLNGMMAPFRGLVAWFATYLFLGSQIAWVLRPFIWDPAGPVEFIGRQYFHGSFYETVFEAARRLLFP